MKITEITKEEFEKLLTDEMLNDFNVLAFSAPFVIVERKSDNKKGSLMFQHSPRYYFSFKEKD